MPFQPAPYVPSAKRPTERPPRIPQKPCTEMAPQGSSILNTRSFNRTPRQTTNPARIPMITAEVGPTKAHGAVMATSPASMPLHAMVMSGLPNMRYQINMAAALPATAARLVLTATTAIRKSVAPSVEPGLKPIQPNSRMNVPVTTKTRLCAGNARGFPSALYLPSRGPSMIARAIALKPPIACTTVEPAKSTYPCPRFMLEPSCESQPPPHAQHPKIG